MIVDLASKIGRNSLLFAHFSLLSSTVIKAFILLAALFSAVHCHASDDQFTSLVSLPNSHIHIYGSSTITNWHCESGQVIARAFIQKTIQTDAESFDAAVNFLVQKDRSPSLRSLVRAARPQVEISIPVKTFECGSEPMEQDMRSALKETAFPIIHYQLRELSRASSEPLTKQITLETNGLLTVAGHSENAPIHFYVMSGPNESLRVVGQQKFRLTQFDVQPPTAFFGLLRAADEITIFFDLAFAQQ